MLGYANSAGQGDPLKSSTVVGGRSAESGLPGVSINFQRAS